jgi:hypothetical protein
MLLFVYGVALLVACWSPSGACAAFLQRTLDGFRRRGIGSSPAEGQRPSRTKPASSPPCVDVRRCGSVSHGRIGRTRKAESLHPETAPRMGVPDALSEA